MAEEIPSTQLYSNPQGQLTELPPLRAKYASDFGYTPATQQQVAQHLLNQKYSTGAQQLATAGEAAAQTLTFGLSTHVEKALGVSPESIKAREEINPISHGIGTAVGIALPAIATAGGTLPESMGGAAARGAAELAAPSLISRAGMAGRGLIEAAVGTQAKSMAGQVLQRGAALAGQGAVEGALYTGGQLVHESALGDPHLVAQSAMSRIGMGALLGGSLGATLGIAEKTLPRAITAATDGLSSLGRKAVGAAEEYYPRVASRLTGESPELISELVSSRGKTLYDNPKELLRYGKDVHSGLTDLHEGVEKAANKYTKAGPELPTQGEAQSTFQGAYNKYLASRETVSEFLGKNGPEEGKVLNWIKGLDKPEGVLQSEYLDTHIDNSRKLVEAIREGSPHLPTSIGNADALQDVVNKTGDLITKTKQQSAMTAASARMAGGAGDGVLGLGPMGEMMAGAALHAHLGPLAPISAGLHSLYRVGTNVPQVARWLGVLEDLSSKTTNNIANGAAAVFRTGAETAERAAGLKGAQLSKLMTQVQNFSANPEGFQQHLVDSHEGLSAHAPNISQAMQIATSAAVGFLASKIPQHPPQGALDKPGEPSAAEQAVFKRYADAANKPTSILEDIKHGTLTPEALEAVKTIAPQLLQQMQVAVMNAAAKSKTIPYQKRLMLNMFMGQSMDGSMQQPVIAGHQAAFSSPPQKTTGVGSKPHPSAGKITQGNRMQTDAQASSNRRAQE